MMKVWEWIKLQQHKLDELHLDAYENAKKYKERTKWWYESKFFTRISKKEIWFYFLILD